jgi:membrane-bound lytic murein transglycosylase D
MLEGENGLYLYLSLTSTPYLRNIPRMTFRKLKDLAIIALLASGLTGCTQLFGTDGNAPGTDAGSGKMRHAYSARTKYYSHSKFSSEALGEPDTPDPSADFFSSSGGDFWQHLRHDFQLPAATNQPQVQAQINWFLHNREYLDRTLRRAGPYMYYILQEVEKRDLPGELVLLPVQESDFLPSATSPAGAVGMWQLMRSTARGFGVKQDFWFDGRRDIYASTNAALDYLTYLQNFFGGDWMLAIAAYDSGEGTVQNAIHRNTRKNIETDFWNLPLPAETRAYIPQLLALVAIIRDPNKYGITLPPVDDKPYLSQIDIGAPISLARAAQLAGLSLAQIKQLNPGYSRMMTDPNGPYKLILPIDRIALFKEQLATVPSLPKTTWGRYRVQRGDTLASIAAHYHTSVSELVEANHLRVRRAPTGKVIMIPTGTQQVTPHVDDNSETPENNSNNPIDSNDAVTQAAHLAPVTDNSANTDNNATQTATDTTDSDTTADSDTDTSIVSKPVIKQHIHIVKHNETLSSIAKQYHVKVNDLLRWNKLHNSQVKPGEKLTIHAPAAATSSSSTTHNKVIKKTVALHTKTTVRPNHYVVKSGDTVSGIAKKLGVKTTNLIKWNNLAASSSLKPGEKLVVH